MSRKCTFVFISEPEPPDIESIEAIINKDKEPHEAALVIKWKVGIYYDPETGVS